MDPLKITNLTSLVGSSNSTVRLPSPESIVNLIIQRSKQEITSTLIGDTNLLVLNSNGVSSLDSDQSKAEYEENCYSNLRTAGGVGITGGAGGINENEIVQPHAYEFACRVYLMMRRTGETQSIIFSGLSGSGSTTQHNLFTSQLLRLSTYSKKEARISEQVQALSTILSSFGSAKTSLNSSATRHSNFLELHFSSNGRLAGAKVLAFGLDKTRVFKLARDERTFHAFYQLLAGATNEERNALGLLDDFTSYSLFQSSGCYRLPEGPNSDDSIAFEELRLAFKILGFKPRHISSIFRLLSAILLLSNLTFSDRGERDLNSESAWVENQEVLISVANLLGIAPEDLERGLTNKLRWVRKEMCAEILKAEGASIQRNSLMSSLYSILFSFIVETSNHKLYPGEEEIQQLQREGGSSIIQLDSPGFHSRVQDRPGTGVLLRAFNGFEEFLVNYSNEMVHSYLAEYQFDGDSGVAARAQEDGVRVLDVIPPDGSARLELLRGGRMGGKADKRAGGLLGGLAKTCQSVRKGASTEEADEELIKGMRQHFGHHSAFVAAPGGPGARTAFGIAHYAGMVAYDASGFIETDLDALDPEFVALFRTSEDGFISKLFSGPSLAAEVHPLDVNIIVAAQVSAQPLRKPTPVISSLSTPPAERDPTAHLLDPLEIHPLTSQFNATLSQLINLMDRTRVWSITSLRPNDSGNSGNYDTKRLQAQISAFLIPQLIARKKTDYVSDVDYPTFSARHDIVGEVGSESTKEFLEGLGLVEKVEFSLGNTRVWLSYKAWRVIEDRLRSVEPIENRAARANDLESSSRPSFNRMGRSSTYSHGDGLNDIAEFESTDDLGLLANGQQPSTPRNNNPFNDSQRGYSAYGVDNLGLPLPYIQASAVQSDVWGDDKDSPAGFNKKQAGEGVIDSKGRVKNKTKVEMVPTSKGRRFWVAIVWLLTWWIPSFTLTYLGRMKRPDVRMAWREKVTLCMLIGLFCSVVIFYIVVFGKIICPNYDKAWNAKELGFHTGNSDYWVAVRGTVYDLTNFYKLQHSDIPGVPVVTSDMLALGGQDLTNYFPVPLTAACPTLVTDVTLAIRPLNFTQDIPTAMHVSGSQQPVASSELHMSNWYSAVFLPRMATYHKGPLVWNPSTVLSEAQGSGRLWAIYDNGIYDLTDYYNTMTLIPNNPGYSFLNTRLASLWQGQAGTDVTSSVEALKLDPTVLATNLACMKTLFYVGETDFRLTPKCQVQPYLLLTFSIILVATILAKFLAALQFGSKRTPELRDKFVICQVPCYTEGEESLRKTIDSLATLTYDDKRKLLLIICDGMIIGSGNDRPTPRIVLDILGVDQNVDPDPLMFKSVSEGSKQLNYGKIWSGLYEVEGHVVPYVVVAKVGRPSERSRPGNRGKRDSQILAMRFLNRVHFDSEMYPLELEMYHQIKNVIGVDPILYEYMLVIDADTSVAHDSLNRLVSCAADDSKIIGICGETKLENEQASWWTMIQVYEYFISHHMSKAFESLFGSVTCLPGCFTMYRIRSADKGKPLLVSSLIIDEYSECNLDTLHKKNLLSLGEDRYLTTLILKHFPNYKTKFTADAQAMTVAPDRWSILISQRRRWINSTVHNLAELLFLPDMCGFCCFGMRFIIIIDLVGTLILPATFVYLVYLIVTVSTGSAAVPIISLVMLGAVYGLQALIFLLKRQWQFIGWLVIYILAYPIYSFILPLYSFWCFDDFTWGSTRVVVGEGKNKKVLQNEDEEFDESSIPMKKFSEYQAALLEDDKEGSIHSLDSRHTQSTAGFSLATKFPGGGNYDYYRDTKAHQTSSRPASRATMGTMGTPFNSLPSFGYGAGGPGSVQGFGVPPSDYGFTAPNQNRMSTGTFNMVSSYYPPQSIPAAAAVPLPASRRDSTMSAYTGYGGLQTAPSIYSTSPFVNSTPLPISSPSTPTINPINLSADPSEQEIITSLKTFLAGTDLMLVTKKSCREALSELFPNADLTTRKLFINSSIDSILLGKL